MLLQFSVENYRSYKDRVVLSMEASSDKEHPDNVVLQGNDRVLKTAAIFGANASGKTNLFIALSAAILNIRLSNQFQVGQPLYNIIPFLFDEESKNQPSQFEFVFIQNGIKYVYGFSATSLEVKKEYLYAFKTSKATTIFERDETREDVYRFTIPAIKKELEPITGKNTKNKLFLSTATQWNSAETKEPFEFFANGINSYDSKFDSLLPKIGPALMDDPDQSMKQFILELLKNADIHIDDFVFEAKEQTADEFLGEMPPVLRGFVQNQIVPESRNIKYSIKSIHKVGNAPFVLNIRDESDGTRNLFGMAPILKQAFQKTGECICIDEFDRSMHPLLVRMLIDLFNDPSVNICHAQLIVSTHDVTLMSQDHLRRDQIYFVDKKRETASSELFSLDEFSPRKSEDIRKAYLLGRYGAIPEIKEGIKLKK